MNNTPQDLTQLELKTNSETSYSEHKYIHELTEAVLAAKLDYWQHQLEGIPPTIELPGDRPRSVVQAFSSDSQSFQLSPEISKQLQAFSAQTGVTLFITLLSAFGVLMVFAPAHS
jgi:hypothetical protein